MDVWKQRRGEANRLVSTLESRVTELKAKRQRVIDAFLHERSIDRATYQEQLDSLNDEIALVQLEVYDARLEELDVEAALNYATNALRNAAKFWSQCSPDQKQTFQRVLFPEGLVFEGEGFEPLQLVIAFSYLHEISIGESSLASRTGVEPVSPP